MLTHRTLDLGRPYHRLQPWLVDAPSLIKRIVPDVVAQAIVRQRPDAGTSHLLTTAGLPVRVRLGRTQMTIASITVPLRWESELDPDLFPPVVEAELIVTPAAEHSARAVLRIRCADPETGDAGAMREVVEAAADAYLRALAEAV
jgi:hypothetical protein